MEHVPYDSSASVHHMLVSTVTPSRLEKAYEFWLVYRPVEPEDFHIYPVLLSKTHDSEP